MDDAAETSASAYALAMFVKAFEQELRNEVLSDADTGDELVIHVAHIDRVPEELRKLMEDQLGIGKTLSEQHCAVTRPADFDTPLPTSVFIDREFFHGLTFGEGVGGSLQVMFGFTLIEIAYQLLRGQVELEAIRPKVVSLVRRTL